MNSLVSTVIPHKFNVATNIIEIFHDLADIIEIVNSCLTLPLVCLMLHFFILNLFSLYNLIWTFMMDYKNFSIVVSTDATFVALNCIFQGMIAHASYATTKEAKMVLIIISKTINNKSCTRDQCKAFKNFLIQSQYRNLKFQNIFFVINWKLIVTV